MTAPAWLSTLLDMLQAITSTLTILFQFGLCPPTIIAAGPYADVPWVQVQNLCGKMIALDDFAVRGASVSWAESATVDGGKLQPFACHTYELAEMPLPGECLTSLGIFDVCDDIFEALPLTSVGVGDKGSLECAGELDDIAPIGLGEAAYLLGGSWVAAPDTGPQPCAADVAKCLRFVAVSPEDGWIQLENVCDHDVEAELGGRFGYCDDSVGKFGPAKASLAPGECSVVKATIGNPGIGEVCALWIRASVDGYGGDVLFIGDEGVCLEGYDVDDLDAPEPWPGEAVYLVDGVWLRLPDTGPIACG